MLRKLADRQRRRVHRHGRHARAVVMLMSVQRELSDLLGLGVALGVEIAHLFGVHERVVLHLTLELFDTLAQSFDGLVALVDERLLLGYEHVALLVVRVEALELHVELFALLGRRCLQRQAICIF